MKEFSVVLAAGLGAPSVFSYDSLNITAVGSDAKYSGLLKSEVSFVPNSFSLSLTSVNLTSVTSSD